MKYDGIVIVDHSVVLIGGGNAQLAYGFAYLKALLRKANG